MLLTWRTALITAACSAIAQAKLKTQQLQILLLQLIVVRLKLVHQLAQNELLSTTNYFASKKNLPMARSMQAVLLSHDLRDKQWHAVVN
jgi:hypothetical protein